MAESPNPDRVLAAALSAGEAKSWVDVVSRQVAALKFGSVQITVHDGRVVQIETSVKVRFDKP
ncbi:MAG: YezD family protein [Terrimicrobiaceae bacterium]